MLYGIIYVIRNTVNGKCYVGQTARSLAIRWNEHLKESRRNHPRYLLHRALNKYGESKFIVEAVASGSSQEELDRLEEYWCYELKSMSPTGYNLSVGVSQGRLSDNTKRKISASHSSNGARLLRSEHSTRYWANPTNRENYGKKIKAKWQDPEYKLRLGEKLRHTREMREAQRQAQLKPETNKIRSTKALDRWANSEFRNKVMASFQNPESRAKRSFSAKVWRRREVATHLANLTEDELTNDRAA